MKYLLNKTNKVIVLALLILGVSCADLEEEPRNVLDPDTFFKSSRDVETAVMGAHGILQTRWLYGRDLLMMLLLRGDMVSIGNLGTSAHRVATDNFTIDPAAANAGDIQRPYEYGYRVITAANNAIQGADIVGDGTPGVIELRAEARFLRAFMYYHLVRIFGGVTILDVLPDDPVTVETFGRNSEQEVYDLIISDFQFAKDNLPDDQGSRSRPTKGTAAAYLASVYLTRGNYSGAYTESKFVIDNAGRFGYALEGDFANLFNSEVSGTSSEPLFLLDFANSVSPGNGGSNQDFTASILGPSGNIRVNGKNGWSVTVPTQAVFDTWEDGDYRKETSFMTEAIANGPGVGNGPDGIEGTADSIVYEIGDVVPYTDWGAFGNPSPRPHIAKYFTGSGNSGGAANQSDNNYIAMRYAEVLLIAAEAAVMGGGGSEAEAIGYVNQIRERARSGVDGSEARTVPTDFVGSLTQADIIEERRLELAFEWKRWYDIKRLQIGDEVFGDSGLEPQPAFNASRDYLMPIPQIVIQLNGSINQNPGY